MTYTYRSLHAGAWYDLPDYESMSMGFEYSDIAGCTLTYPTDGINSDHVVEDATVVALWDGVEVKNGRWVLQGSSGSNVTDGGSQIQIMGKNLFTVFAKTVVHTPAGTDTLTFSATTVGGLLVNLFTAAQARGAMTGVTWDFTNTVDSAGNAWGFTFNTSCKATDEYLKIIQTLVDQGLVELQFNGTVIQAFKSDGMGTDKSGTIELAEGLDYLETPFKKSVEARAHYALILGDDGTSTSYSNSGSGPYGREEIGITQGGTKDTALLGVVAQNAVDQVANAAQEFTRKVDIEHSLWVPGADYAVADWISERMGGVSTTYRVRSLTIGVDSDGIASASLVLNDRILESAIKQARKIANLTNGGTGTGSSGVPTAATDKTIPNPPTSVLFTSNAYQTTDGTTRAYMTVTWTPPTQNTDGSQITDLQDYEVQYKRTTDTKWKTTVVTTAYAVITDLDPGATVQIQVRARDNANPQHVSAWSAITSGTVSVDNIAPPTPATPTASLYLGAVNIAWTGKGSSGELMPPDTVSTRVWASKINNFDPTTDATAQVVATINAINKPVQVAIGGLDYNVPYYFKLVAVDRTGNLSPASAQVTATPRQVTGDDMVGQIRAALGQRFYDDMSDTSQWELVAGTGGTLTAMSSPDAQAGGKIAQASGGRNQYWVHKALVPYDPSELYRVSIRIRENPANTTSTFYAGVVGVAADGSTLVNSTGANTTGGQFYCAAQAADATGVWTTWVGYIKGLSDTPGSGVATDPEFPRQVHTLVRYIRPLVITNYGTVDGTVHEIDMVKVEAVPTGFVANINIGTAAIQTAQIGDAQVINAKIHDVAADKIVTGTLQAGVSISAGDPAGSHAEMTATGFYAYADDPVDNVPNLAVRMGTIDNDLFSIVDASGITQASISDLGEGSFQKIYTENDPEIMGMVLLGSFANFDSPTEQEDANPGLLDKLPRGVVAWGSWSDSTKFTVREITREISFNAQPGRTYRVHLSGSNTAFASANTVGGYALVMTLPSAVGGEAPSPQFTNYTTILFGQTTAPVANMTVTTPSNCKALRCNPGGISVGGELTPGIVKVALMVLGDLCNTTLSTADTVTFWVEDVGPDIPSTAIANGSINGGTQQAPATVRTYAKVYASTSSATYKGDGTKRTDTSDVVQGYNSYNGDGKGLWIFPSMTSDLSGATIKKVEVYAYANHWYYNSGGSALVKVHGYTSAPASSPSMTTAVTSSGFPYPGGRWVTLPSSLWAGFKSGTYRGFGMGPSGGTNLLYYGRFNGGTAARIRVTYVK